MARKTKDEAEKTREKILNAAEKVFYKNGVARSSLDQVAKQAKVTRGAVYWHFEDKNALCIAMANRIFLPYETVMAQLVGEQNSDPLHALEQAICKTLEEIATNERYYRVASILMLRCEYVKEMSAIMNRRRECKSRMMEQCRILFTQAKNNKQLSAKWQPEEAAASLQSMMTGALVHGLEERKDFNLATTGVNCIKAFFRSLAT